MNGRTSVLRFKPGIAVPEATDGRLVFQKLSVEDVADRLDFIKHLLKRYRGFYKLAKYVLSPMYFDGSEDAFIARHVEGKEGCFLNLGSGNFRLHERIVNADIFAYDEVDLVCDITRLPLQDDSVDVILNLSLLEHVPTPEGIVQEMLRVLKPGGIVYTDAPFLVGFHASPYDFSRWTDVGLKRLFRDFEIEEFKIAAGPTSALLWIFQEWLAMLLSFGSAGLHQMLHIALMILTFPLKYLDILLRRHPAAKNISASFVLVARKPARP